MFNEGDFSATAVFWDAIWHVTERLNWTVGLRYTHDSKDFSWLNGPREAPELDASLAALQAAGFFDDFPDTARGVSVRRRVRAAAGARGAQGATFGFLGRRQPALRDRLRGPARRHGVRLAGQGLQGRRLQQRRGGLAVRQRGRLEPRGGRQERLRARGARVQCLGLLLRLRRPAVDRARLRRERLRRAAIPDGHERRGSLRHRCRVALAAVRRSHALRERRVHRRNLRRQGCTRRDRPLRSSLPASRT